MHTNVAHIYKHTTQNILYDSICDVQQAHASVGAASNGNDPSGFLHLIVHLHTRRSITTSISKQTAVDLCKNVWIKTSAKSLAAIMVFSIKFPVFFQ